MQPSRISLLAFPPTVRRAFWFLAAGWISLVLFIYHINMYFPGKINDQVTLRVAIVGIVICYFVYRAKSWARALCIFFNIGSIVINGLFLVPVLSSPNWNSSFLALTMHALVNILLFVFSTYYLLVKPTAAFYRENLKKSREAHSGENQQ